MESELILSMDKPVWDYLAPQDRLMVSSSMKLRGWVMSNIWTSHSQAIRGGWPIVFDLTIWSLWLQ